MGGTEGGQRRLFTAYPAPPVHGGGVLPGPPPRGEGEPRLPTSPLMGGTEGGQRRLFTAARSADRPHFLRRYS